MGQTFSINGKPASREDFELVKKYIENNGIKCGSTPQPYCAKEVTALSQKNLIDFFDGQGNRDGKIDDQDGPDTGLVNRNGFEPVRKTLSKYGIHFYGKYELDPAKKSDPKRLLESYISQKRFVFVAECHGVMDEAFIAPWISDLKKKGLINLAVELPRDAQPGIDRFLATGDDSLLPPHLKVWFKEDLGMVKLMKAAHKAGIKVVAFDIPTPATIAIMQEYMTNPQKAAERERLISDKLLQLSGKTLVMTGAEHAAIDENPYSTARSLVEKSAPHSTAAIKLENFSWIEMIQSDQESSRLKFDQSSNAFLVYFGSKSPATITAYETSQMGLLTYTDPSARPNQLGQDRLYYRNAYDAVFFMPLKESPLTEALKRLKRK